MISETPRWRSLVAKERTLSRVRSDSLMTEIRQDVFQVSAVAKDRGPLERLTIVSTLFAACDPQISSLGDRDAFAMSNIPHPQRHQRRQSHVSPHQLPSSVQTSPCRSPFPVNVVDDPRFFAFALRCGPGAFPD